MVAFSRDFAFAYLLPGIRKRSLYFESSLRLRPLLLLFLSSTRSYLLNAFLLEKTVLALSLSPALSPALSLLSLLLTLRRPLRLLLPSFLIRLPPRLATCLGKQGDASSSG